MTAFLVGLLIILCIAVIAANELRKRGVGQGNPDRFLDDAPGDWPDVSSFKSFGGVHNARRPKP